MIQISAYIDSLDPTHLAVRNDDSLQKNYYVQLSPMRTSGSMTNGLFSWAYGNRIRISPNPSSSADDIGSAVMIYRNSNDPYPTVIFQYWSGSGSGWYIRYLSGVDNNFKYQIINTSGSGSTHFAIEPQVGGPSSLRITGTKSSDNFKGWDTINITSPDGITVQKKIGEIQQPLDIDITEGTTSINLWQQTTPVVANIQMNGMGKEIIWTEDGGTPVVLPTTGGAAERSMQFTASPTKQLTITAGAGDGSDPEITVNYGGTNVPEVTDTGA